MKTFTYTIQDEVGIHARPAGLLAKKAKEFQSTITMEKGGCEPDQADGGHGHGREVRRHRDRFC